MDARLISKLKISLSKGSCPVSVISPPCSSCLDNGECHCIHIERASKYNPRIKSNDSTIKRQEYVTMNHHFQNIVLDYFSNSFLLVVSTKCNTYLPILFLLYFFLLLLRFLPVFRSIYIGSIEWASDYMRPTLIHLSHTLHLRPISTTN